MYKMIYKELLPSILAIAALCLVIRLTWKRPWGSLVYKCVCLIYLAGLIYFTMFFGARNGIASADFSFPMPIYKALVNGKYTKAAHESVLNVLLFIPFGFLLPYDLCLKRKKNILLKTVMLSFAASLLIEILQITLQRGVFEIDDLAKNTLGAALGCLIWVLLKDTVYDSK